MGRTSTGHKMGFTRFVEMGRVVVVNYGDDAGKLGMIVDVIDQNRCLVYSPYTSLPRTEMGYKRLSLTDLKVSIQRAARVKTSRRCGPLRKSRASGVRPPGQRKSQHANTRQPAPTSKGSRTWSPRRTPRSKQG